MDKQKSYGKRYNSIKAKRKISFKFVGTTIFFCIMAVVLCFVFVGEGK